MHIDKLRVQIECKEVQFFQIQKFNSRFTLIEIDSSRPDFQTNLIYLLSTDMFAFYSKNENRIFLNNKVVSEIEKSSSNSNKASDLRSAILTAANENDEIHTADVSAMDEEQESLLKLVVTTLELPSKPTFTEKKSGTESNPKASNFSANKSFVKTSSNEHASSTSTSASASKNADFEVSQRKRDRQADELEYIKERKQNREQILEAQKHLRLKGILEREQLKRTWI